MAWHWLNVSRIITKQISDLCLSGFEATAEDILSSSLSSPVVYQAVYEDDRARNESPEQSRDTPGLLCWNTEGTGVQLVLQAFYSASSW